MPRWVRVEYPCQRIPKNLAVTSVPMVRGRRRAGATLAWQRTTKAYEGMHPLVYSEGYLTGYFLPEDPLPGNSQVILTMEQAG